MTDDRPPPSRGKARLLLLIAGLFFFVPPIAVGLVLYGSFDRPPDLAVDLPSEPDARRAAFRARVEATFPPGTPETRLAGALREQGFDVSKAAQEDWSGRAAVAVETWTCTTTYEVKWRSDEAGGIVAVDADVNAPCP